MWKTMVDGKETAQTERKVEAENISTQNAFNRFQSLIDKNVRLIRYTSWIVGGVGILAILRRTYAFHHFTEAKQIPENYFKNNATLVGKVFKIHNNGQLSIMHLPLLWRARINYLSHPEKRCLKVNMTGLELQSGGRDFLRSRLNNTNIKFQLLGRDENESIEAVIYHNKTWFRRKLSVNEEVMRKGLAKVRHVPTLSKVQEYNRLIEKLAAAEFSACKKRYGVWKEDLVDDRSRVSRILSWFKSKIF